MSREEKTHKPSQESLPTSLPLLAIGHITVSSIPAWSRPLPNTASSLPLISNKAGNEGITPGKRKMGYTEWRLHLGS